MILAQIVCSENLSHHKDSMTKALTTNAIQKGSISVLHLQCELKSSRIVQYASS